MGQQTFTVSGGSPRIEYVKVGIDPRLKVLLVALRRALIIIADALKEYYDG
jgi:hypothetical protein